MADNHYKRDTKRKLTITLDLTIEQISNYFALDEEQLKDAEGEIVQYMPEEIEAYFNSHGSCACHKGGANPDNFLGFDRASIKVDNVRLISSDSAPD